MDLKKKINYKKNRSLINSDAILRALNIMKTNPENYKISRLDTPEMQQLCKVMHICKS